MTKPFVIGEIDKLTGSPSRAHTKEALSELGYGAVSCGERRIYMLDGEDLDSILRWAVEGWHNLREAGRFVQPRSSLDVVSQWAAITSPVRTFVSERCVVRPGATVEIRELFEAWECWCAVQRRESGTIQSFGRDLRANVPGLADGRRRYGTSRVRVYEGIELAEGG